MKKAEKDLLIEQLKNLELGIREAQSKGVYELSNAATLFHSIVELNKHLMTHHIRKEVSKQNTITTGTQ